jgi:hypothetical protein
VAFRRGREEQDMPELSYLVISQSGKLVSPCETG